MDNKEKCTLKSLIDNANKQLDILFKELKTDSKKDIDLLKNTLNKEELTLEKEETPNISLEKEEIGEVPLEEKENENSLKKIEENIIAKTDVITNSGNEFLEKIEDSTKKIEEKVNKILNIFS